MCDDFYSSLTVLGYLLVVCHNLGPSYSIVINYNIEQEIQLFGWHIIMNKILVPLERKTECIFSR